MYLCVCVCVKSNQSISKITHYVSDLSKLDTLFYKTNIKVLLVLSKVSRLDMCRSILLFNKKAHQMWLDHSFSQKNMTTERTVRVGLGGDREVEEGLDKI